MLSARSIATLGVGFGARQIAHLGLWPTGDAPPPTPPKPPVEWLGGGGSLGRLDIGQSADEKRREREALGIIPPAVERAVEVVARIEARGQTAYEKVSDHARAELKAYLDTENEAWYNLYDELLRTAVIRIIEEQNEEQEIMMLLFEM